MPLFAYAWPDGSCTLTRAATLQAAVSTLARLGPVEGALIVEVPAGMAEGEVVHYTPPRRRYGLRIRAREADPGLRPLGAPVAAQAAEAVRR